MPTTKNRFLDQVSINKEDRLSQRNMPQKPSEKLERKQFTEKASVQMHTKHSCIPIQLADTDYIALRDTGSDISTIPEKNLFQNENLRRLPRFKSDITEATTAAENNSVFLNIQCFQR